MSLGLIGAIPITSFSENNIRARACKIAYDSQTELLLSEHDWTFARRFAKINLVSHDPSTMPLLYDGYQLPVNCATPRDIDPPGSRNEWEIAGTLLMAPSSIYASVTTLGLYYTASDAPVGDFSGPFTELLTLAIASKIAYPITQDRVLASELRNEYRGYRMESWEMSANIGKTYKSHDERYENDTFVEPTL